MTKSYVILLSIGAPKIKMISNIEIDLDHQPLWEIKRLAQVAKNTNVQMHATNGEHMTNASKYSCQRTLFLRTFLAESAADRSSSFKQNPLATTADKRIIGSDTV